MEQDSETYDVTIVGFGPTGALLANLLGRDGLRTLVVEREPEVYTLPRAVHFDHEVMRIFQSVGLAERILPHTGPVKGYDFKNAEGKMLMSFDLRHSVTSQGWRSDYMFHQPSLEHVLREGARERDSVEVRLGQELVELKEDGTGVTCTIRGVGDPRESRIRTRFVVGCDGASSLTRRLAGLGMEDLQFDEPWLVVDATVERPMAELGFPDVPLQHCDPRRPVSLIPVVGPYVRWEFMLLPGEGEELQEPARVRALVSEWVDPDQVEIIRSAIYRFHALIADPWRTRRVLIAGDAAHQTPPFLGQGMCAGIRDAANLAWKLRLVVGGHAGDRLLDTYQHERAPHVRHVIDIAVEMGRIVCTQDPGLARARDEQLLGGAPGPGGAPGGVPTELPALPGISCGVLEPEPRHPLAGQLALQARVRDSAGREGLLDDLVGPGFVLLRWGAAETLGREAQDLAERLGIREVRFGGRAGSGGREVRALEDTDGAYGRWFRTHGVNAVLVRPDHVVFGSAPHDADRLVAALDSQLR